MTAIFMSMHEEGRLFYHRSFFARFENTSPFV